MAHCSRTCREATWHVRSVASTRQQPTRSSPDITRAARARWCPGRELSGTFLCLRNSRQTALRPSCSAVAALPSAAPAISISDRALSHLHKLRADRGEADLILRIGVKSGGCSGMSYLMEFESAANVGEDDNVMTYDDAFQLVCDSKSLLYLFGLRLDYSDALIGGGFQFVNPNAETHCGCGKSFSV